MHDELVRSVVAVAVALLLPFGLPGLGPRWRRGLLAAVVVLAALAPHLDRWQTWVVLVATVAAAVVPAGQPTFARPRVPLALLVAALAVAVGVTDAAATGEALEAVAQAEGIPLVVGGWLVSTFTAGALIGRVLAPFAERVRRDADEDVGMENAGRYIGWLERTLLYGLLILGSADAAALVLAGKSIARFPEFRKTRFAEYYLIGSLLSLTIAAAFALAVRAALGLRPLLGA